MSEYDDGFDAGILHQCMQERDEDARRELKQRAAAFGAIRRAAAMAREHDNYAEHGGLGIDDRKYWEGSSRQIRKEIRAAIGSAKT